MRRAPPWRVGALLGQLGLCRRSRRVEARGSAGLKQQLSHLGAAQAFSSHALSDTEAPVSVEANAEERLARVLESRGLAVESQTARAVLLHPRQQHERVVAPAAATGPSVAGTLLVRDVYTDARRAATGAVGEVGPRARLQLRSVLRQPE
eukprot:scaffold7594_cov111-Isochrysis_galbana.AAC.6